jgi:single-strand DNA-binding protein
MTDINSVTIIGRLTKDGSECFKYLPTGTACLNFSIAVNETYKAKDGKYEEFTNFFECSLFGKSAETLKDYFRKGNRIAVVGSLRQSTWQGKDGKKASKVVIMVDNVQLLTPKNDTNNAPQSAPQQTQNNFQNQTQTTTQPNYRQQNYNPNESNFQSFDTFTEDVPF